MQDTLITPRPYRPKPIVLTDEELEKIFGPKPLSKDEAKLDLISRLHDGETPSQNDLANAWNRPKQTVSDWLKTWEKDDRSLARVKTGRYKMVLAA